MCVMEEDGEELQIDLGPGSRAEPRTAAEGQSGMTWLQAAEHVLRENGGPGMHIRDLTRTILELGIVRLTFCDPLSYSLKPIPTLTPQTSFLCGV